MARRSLCVLGNVLASGRHLTVCHRRREDDGHLGEPEFWVGRTIAHALEAQVLKIDGLMGIYESCANGISIASPATSSA